MASPPDPPVAELVAVARFAAVPTVAEAVDPLTVPPV
jgi:hypothetical protein